MQRRTWITLAPLATLAAALLMSACATTPAPTTVAQTIAANPQLTTATRLISEAGLAVEMGAYAEDVALTIHPHPTLSEGMNESFKHALKEAVHIMNK